jgi:hypothetical protein
MGTKKKYTRLNMLLHVVGAAKFIVLYFVKIKIRYEHKCHNCLKLRAFNEFCDLNTMMIFIGILFS